MTVMMMRRLLPSDRQTWRRTARWGAAAAGMLALPKCIGCVVTYFTLAGAAGVELCGAPVSDNLLFAPAVALSGLATALVLRTSVTRRIVFTTKARRTRRGCELRTDQSVLEHE